MQTAALLRWAARIGSLVSLTAFYVWMLALDGRLPPGPYFILLASPALFFLASWSIRRQ